MEQGYVYINDIIFPTLLAVSTEEQSRGLMFQEWPPPVMSFVYASPGVNRFWMKNTPSPLDIVFCHNGKVSEICYGEPHNTSIVGSQISDLVIELPHGTVESAGIKVGQAVGLFQPTLEQLRETITKKSKHFVKF